MEHLFILPLFFLLFGSWIFFVSLGKRGQFLWLSGFLFVLSAYTYHAWRLFAPLLLLGLVVIYRGKLFKFKKSCLIAFVVSFLFALPLFKIMLSVEGQTRLKMTFVSQDENIAPFLHQPGERLTLIKKIFDNNFFILGNFWIKRYLNYWDPGFLFFKGMKLSLPGAPDIGLFYLFELPLFVFGLWKLFFGHFLSDKARKLTIFWLLIGPLPASLTNNEQHAWRSLTAIPAPQVVLALGGVFLWNLLRRINFGKRIGVLAAVILIVVVNLFYWADLYFVHYPIQFSEYWDYGLKEAAIFSWEHYNEYDQIVVDNIFGTLGPYIVGTPHLYMLFYGRYDPAVLQKERSVDKENFGKFIFRTIYWPKDRLLKKTLFIGSPWRLPLEDVNKDRILKKIYFKNGSLGFLIVET